MPPVIDEFTQEQEKYWKPFWPPFNERDSDRTVDLVARERPFNDAEKCMKERMVPGYAVDAGGRILTFGEDNSAVHFHFDEVLTKNATQKDVADLVRAKFEAKDHKLQLFMGYG